MRSAVKSVIIGVFVGLLCGYSTCSDTQETLHNASAEQGFNSEFVHMVGSTLEDGFFGGVKWGIAAAVYHVLYRVMALAVGSVPQFAQAVRAWYAYWSDSRAARPPKLDIHELQVLVSLLQEAIQEYEMLRVFFSDQHPCAILPGRTLSAVMLHVYEYIALRSVRYTDLYTDQEVIFLMKLIGDTIQSILECIGCAEFHQEVITTAKTTVVLIQKLILLLQGPEVDKESYDPAMAWFSGKRICYALCV